MKKTVIILTLGILLFSCKNEKKVDQKIEKKAEISNSDASVSDTKSTGIDWDEMPDLKDIGNFPFVTAPTGLEINNEKDGISEYFDFETMEVYTGTEVIGIEGKLGIVDFDGADDKNFNQKLFDRGVYDYFDGIGAKKIYTGDFPEDEKQRKKLEKNMWSGKHGTKGLIRESDAPFSVYAFKNNGKKYILNIQSNSAQGTIFIMELKDFEQTIKKYTATEMLNEIELNGRAILNINFDTDKATLKPDGENVVEEILKLLNTNSKLKISIEGHTDNTGIIVKNKQLSFKRANTVLYFLASKGIDRKRLKSIGFGSEKPIKPNDTEANKAINRRVELVKF